MRWIPRRRRDRLALRFAVVARSRSLGSGEPVGGPRKVLDGPRILANMAADSWVPRRFAQLSDRLVTNNGIWLMGIAALATLVYTRGSVGRLVVMYAINVFRRR